MMLRAGQEADLAFVVVGFCIMLLGCSFHSLLVTICGLLVASIWAVIIWRNDGQ